MAGIIINLQEEDIIITIYRMCMDKCDKNGWFFFWESGFFDKNL